MVSTNRLIVESSVGFVKKVTEIQITVTTMESSMISNGYKSIWLVWLIEWIEKLNAGENCINKSKTADSKRAETCADNCDHAFIRHQYQRRIYTGPTPAVIEKI